MNKTEFDKKIVVIGKDDKEFAQAIKDKLAALELSEKSVVDLTEKLEAANKLAADTQTQLDEALKAAEALEATIAEKDTEIAALTDQLGKRPENPRLVKGTAKVEGKTYKFKEGFVKTRWKGEVVKSEDLLQDKEAMQYLVKIGYGGLEEVK